MCAAFQLFETDLEQQIGALCHRSNTVLISEWILQTSE